MPASLKDEDDLARSIAESSPPLRNLNLDPNDPVSVAIGRGILDQIIQHDLVGSTFPSPYLLQGTFGIRLSNFATPIRQVCDSSTIIIKENVELRKRMSGLAPLTTEFDDARQKLAEMEV